MTRCPTEEERFAYADRTVGVEERARIAPHVRRCQRCADDIRQIEAMIQDICTAYATWPEDLPSADASTGPAEIPFEDEPEAAQPHSEPEAQLPQSGRTSAAASEEPSGRSEQPQAPRSGGLLPRWKLPGYRFLAPLNRGGMGSVYVALQESMDRKVAVKVLAPSLASDPKYVQRFEREAKACARLRHPHIVQVFDVGMVGRRPYLVMEYVDGIDLAKRISRRPLRVREVLACGVALASGLERAHKENIIHRDIKPSNVLIGKDGSVKLADLGLAKQVDELATNLTAVGTCLGSPSYMPPEQAKDFKDVGPEADVYSLGATLYHALYGRPPFEGDNTLQILQLVLLEEPEFPEDRRDIPAAVVQVLRHCLAKEPHQRYADGGELLQALKAVQAGHAPLAPSSRQPTHSSSRSRTSSGRIPRRRRSQRVEAEPRRSPMLWVGLAAAAAILLAVSAALLLRSPPPEEVPEQLVQQPELPQDPNDLPPLPPRQPEDPQTNPTRIAELEESIARFAERGDVDGVIREHDALLALQPDYDPEALKAWRSEAHRVHDTRRAMQAYERGRPDLYLAFREGGVDQALRFVGRFELDYSEAAAVPELAQDKEDLAVLEQLRSSALRRLGEQRNQEVELELADGYVARGTLLGIEANTLELSDELIDFSELSASEQLRWGKVGDELVALSYLDPAAAYQSVEASLHIPAERYRQVKLFYNTEAEALLTEAESAGEAQDAELQYALLAALDSYRDATPFRERGPEMDQFVDQALAWQTRSGTPARPHRDPVPERTPEPPRNPTPEEGEALAAVSEPTVELNNAQRLKILQNLMTPEVIALETPGRFAVEYSFMQYEEINDWDLHIPKGFDQVDSSRWEIGPLPEEFSRVEDFKRVEVADAFVLFAKGWKRLLWLDLPFEGALTVEAEMQSLDGRNLALGIGETGRVLWGVQGFQTPRLEVSPEDARNPVTRRYVDNFKDFGKRKQNALVWEQIYLFETAVDPTTRDQPSSREVRHFAMVYTPTEDGASMRLEDREREDKPKEILSAELRNAFERPKIALGTFGSHVAISRVRIEFGISDAELSKISKR